MISIIGVIVAFWILIKLGDKREHETALNDERERHMEHLMFEWVCDQERKDLLKSFCDTFNLCPDCGWEYDSDRQHREYDNGDCPTAFLQDCEDWMEFGGYSNSTRSIICSLLGDIKRDEETLLLWVRRVHIQMIDCPEYSEIETDFDEWVKEYSTKDMIDMVWDHLWEYDQDRDILHAWGNEFSVKEFNERTGHNVVWEG